MTEELYNYLEKEWRQNNVPKYQHYFKEWISNLTETQISQYKKIWYGK